MKMRHFFSLLIGGLVVSGLLGYLVVETTVSYGDFATVLAFKIQVANIEFQNGFWKAPLTHDAAILAVLVNMWWKISAIYFTIFCIALGAVWKWGVEENAS